MTPREAILGMLERDDEIALACARTVKRFEGWSLSDDDTRTRLRQCVKGTGGRHFEIDWYPLLQRVFVYFDVPDLVSALFYEARKDAEYEKKREERDNPAREMRTVRPPMRHREVG